MSVVSTGRRRVFFFVFQRVKNGRGLLFLSKMCRGLWSENCWGPRLVSVLVYYRVLRRFREDGEWVKGLRRRLGRAVSEGGGVRRESLRRLLGRLGSGAV